MTGFTARERKTSEWAMIDMNFEDIKGMTFVSVEKTDNDAIVRFTRDNGDIYEQYHSQDCCESVYVESIVGDLEDLVGTPILMAEEVTSSDKPAEHDCYPCSFTWTFYKLRTIKGSVDIRWYGSSNGYYSESVYFRKAN